MKLEKKEYSLVLPKQVSSNQQLTEAPMNSEEIDLPACSSFIVLTSSFQFLTLHSFTSSPYSGLLWVIFLHRHNFYFRHVWGAWEKD
jgi:hypothetical protein